MSWRKASRELTGTREKAAFVEDRSQTGPGDGFSNDLVMLSAMILAMMLNLLFTYTYVHTYFSCDSWLFRAHLD